MPVGALILEDCSILEWEKSYIRSELCMHGSHIKPVLNYHYKPVPVP